MRLGICGILFLSFLSGTAPAQVVPIDNFDSYADMSALRAVWTGGNPILETTTVFSAPNSMTFATGGLGSSGSVAVTRTISPALQFQSGTLTFQYYVSSAQTTIPNGSVRLRITLRDGSFICDLTPEIVPTSRDAWNMASITVPATCGQTDLTSIVQMSVVIANASAMVGTATVYFDDYVISDAVPVEVQQFTVE